MKQEIYEEDVPVKVVRHEIIHLKNKTEEEQLEKLEAKADLLAEQVESFFQSEKKELADKYPKFKNKIEDIQSGFKLEEIRELLEKHVPSKKPTGKATLIERSEPSDLSHAETYGELVNKLYRATKTRDKMKVTQIKEAKRKIDTLMQSALDSGLLRSDRLGKAMVGQTFSVCPQCGSIVKDGLNYRGDSCSNCNYVVGKGIIKGAEYE